jgi:hemerythrin
MIQSAERWSDIESIVANTGIDEVDTDHHKLVEYILELNHLITKIEEDKFNMAYLREQQRLLEKICSYAEEHFAREERLMDQYGIESPNQRAQHRNILSMLDGAIADFKSGKTTVSLSLKVDIMEWVVGHINDVDRKTFDLANWRPVLEAAEKWEDLSFIIKKTGIPLVDDEHRELVECTLRLESAGTGKNAAKNIRNVLGDLRVVVEKHFSDEEGFIEKHKLDGLDKQREQHAIFLRVLKEKTELSDKELLEAFGDLKRFIIEWWCKHINGLDYNTVSFERHVFDLVDNSDEEDDLAWMLAPTSVEEVDGQHMQCLRAIDATRKLYAGGDMAEAEKSFAGMLDFTKEHFAYEEGLMEEMGSPLIEIHKEKHKFLLQKYGDYFTQVKNGNSVFSVYLRNKIVRSLITHTNGIDFETFGNENAGKKRK